MDAGIEYIILLAWIMAMVRVALPPAVRETHPPPQDHESTTGE